MSVRKGLIKSVKHWAVKPLIFLKGLKPAYLSHASLRIIFLFLWRKMLTVKYCGEEHSGWKMQAGAWLWYWNGVSGKIFLCHHAPRDHPSSTPHLCVWMFYIVEFWDLGAQRERKVRERDRFFFFPFFFCFLGLHLQHGGSQARGRIRATAASLHHSNAGSLTYWARPGIEPTTSRLLIGFISASPHWELFDWFPEQCKTKTKQHYPQLNLVIFLLV